MSDEFSSIAADAETDLEEGAEQVITSQHLHAVYTVMTMNSIRPATAVAAIAAIVWTSREWSQEQTKEWLVATCANVKLREDAVDTLAKSLPKKMN